LIVVLLPNHIVTAFSSPAVAEFARLPWIETFHPRLNHNVVAAIIGNIRHNLVEVDGFSPPISQGSRCAPTLG